VTESIESVFFRSGKLATAAELLALGVSKGRLRQWARDRQVTAVARGVYSPTAWLTDMADDPRRLHAVAVGAIIKRNPDLVASHESAAYLQKGRDRARAQLARDEKFHDAGWGTFHFTWREIYHEPAPTIDRLRRAFARNRPRTSFRP
jgi:hypothetical protein